MSYKCAITGKIVEGEIMNRVVTERREKVYTDSEGNETGKGWEIIREISVSAEGMNRLNAAADNDRRLDQAAR